MLGLASMALVVHYRYPQVPVHTHLGYHYIYAHVPCVFPVIWQYHKNASHLHRRSTQAYVFLGHDLSPRSRHGWVYTWFRSRPGQIQVQLLALWLMYHWRRWFRPSSSTAHLMMPVDPAVNLHLVRKFSGKILVLNDLVLDLHLLYLTIHFYHSRLGQDLRLSSQGPLRIFHFERKVEIHLQMPRY